MAYFNNVRVSIVIPVYNMEDYLERCIRSVVGQSYTNLEIVLVDDGSTDGSTAICREWERKDTRIAYIRQDNAGPGEARNSGMKASDCDYITFLDSDDWFEPTFVERIINAIVRDDSEVGQCAIYYVDSVSMNRKPVYLRYDSETVSCVNNKSVINKSRLFAWGKIYKRDLLEKCNFSFPKTAFEDTCIPLLIASANKISYVPEPLINYFRNRTGSLTNDTGKISDIAVGLQLLYEELNEFELYPELTLEYKKIVLGQLRFACRKWSGVDSKSVVRALRELEEFAVKKFPELKIVVKDKYFAFGKSILSVALDNAIPHKEQLSDDIKSADCIVAFEKDILQMPNRKARIIMIPDREKNTKDITTAAFNIAELIMERL